MRYNEVKLKNVHEIIYEYNKDYNVFGDRRYSWYFLRDKNVEFVYEHAYILDNVKSGETFCLENEENQYVFICTQGEYTLTLCNIEDEKTISVSLTSEKKNQIVVGTGVSVVIESVVDNSQLEIMSENSIDAEAEIKAGCETSNSDIIEIFENNTTNNGLAKIYDRDIFYDNNVKIKALFTNIEKFEFENIFRGLYIQEAPRAYASIITCLSGAVQIYAVDMRRNRETYRQVYTYCLSDKNTVLAFDKGFAIGMLSLENNTVVSQKTDEYFDKKYQYRINWNGCLDDSRLNNDTLIISALDKYAEEIEEMQPIKI